MGSLLEVGTGFHPELTGRENIYLNGAILGMHRTEIDRKFDEIVAFSEIEKFIDTPVKHYSSGMHVRLAFSVAAHLEPEIFLIDEVLAVGDVEFQKKCLGKMGEVAKKGRTILFISHNMAAVRVLCKKGILLEHGKIRSIGPTYLVIDEYLSNNRTTLDPEVRAEENPELPIQIQEVKIVNVQGELSSRFSIDSPITVVVELIVRKRIKNSYLAFHLHDKELNSLVFMRDFELDNSLLGFREPDQYQYRITIPAPLLVPGMYSISIHAVQMHTGIVSRLDYICPFEVYDSGSQRAKHGFTWIGKFNPKLTMDITKREIQTYGYYRTTFSAENIRSNRYPFRVV